MKLTKKLFMGALIATSLVCMPHVSRANVITNIIGWLENLGKNNKGNGQGNDNGQGNQGNDNGQGNKWGQDKNGKGDPSTTSNSVPLDGGLILLMVSGVGLGALVINGRRKGATILQ